MTRIETALRRGLHHECEQDPESVMHDESAHGRWLIDIGLLSTPSMAALSALVEAAEAWRGEPSEYRTGQELDEPELCAAVDAFRAATEPQPAGGG